LKAWAFRGSYSSIRKLRIYHTHKEIQAQAIPQLLAGRDMVGQSQTGTGKTAAFSLPMLEQIDIEHRLCKL